MENEVVLMEDMIPRTRNIVVSLMAAATGVPIRLSDEHDPAFPPPYGYYSMVTPYASSGELGSHTRTVQTDPDTGERFLFDLRSEHPEMVLSFVFCSSNRMLEDGKQVNGEEEAMRLAIKAVAWLRHEGARALSQNGLVVLRVGNTASRSGILGDELVRRWGFDLTIRYKAITAKREEIAADVHTIQKKE